MKAMDAMDRLTVLVVDDEPLARRRLVRLLGRKEWVARVEEAADADEARRRAQALQPDILLLDILLPGGSGFEVLQTLAPVPPAVVFVTALDCHALRAFDANAVDYVTKPIDPRRFDLAMERARQAAGAHQHAERLAELQETLSSLRRTLVPQSTRASDIWVKVRGEYLRIAPESILRFQAERDYVRIHLAGASYLYSESMLSLEKRLDPAQFIRIHRSTIVRRAAIAHIRPAPFAALVAVLTDGTPVRIGRTYAPVVRASLAVRR